MKVAIVQLGDIHIRDGNPILGRAGNIRSAVRAVVGDADVYMLAYTGDLVFSGSEAEYGLASNFCDEVKAAFTETDIPPIEVFVPGNHDLYFGKVNDARPILLESLPEQIHALNLSGMLVGQIVSSLDHFFDFVEKRNLLTIPQNERLFVQHTFSFDTVKIQVKCLNTAWMSTLEEKPAKLRFPPTLIASSEDCEDLSIALLHHPYGWFEPNNARQLRARLEETCDVIITGHEHSSIAYRKELAEGQHLHYVEGSALHDPNIPRNGFNVIQVDLEESSYSVTECVWTKEQYLPSETVVVWPFVRNATRVRAEFSNTEHFLQRLKDPGTPFRHPIQKDLRLRDFFIYPDLTTKNSQLKATAVPRLIKSNQVMEYFLTHDHVVVIADEAAGKTSLGKILYEDLQRAKSIVPVLIRGPEFDGVSAKDVRKAVKKAFIDQYGEDNYVRFLGLDMSMKALIIDDWQEIRYNPKGQFALLDHLIKQFGKIICFSTGLIQVEQVTDSSDRTYSPFGSFEFCEIREFGIRLRGALIERWHRLGQEYTLNEHDFLHAVRESEHKINAILGKSFLPSHPLFILTMLQLDDPMAGSGSNLGSYGHLYEVLITRRLSEVSKKATDLGTKYTYISRIAYHLFSNDQLSLSKIELSKLHLDYCSEYRIHLPVDATWEQLRRAQILTNDGDTYRFRYRACYCYFVAKYFQENLANPGSDLRKKLNDIADRVYFEDYSNIIIFFVFLTKDNEIIQKILENGRRIYAEHAPADLANDAGFVDELLKGMLPPILLGPRTAEENREHYRDQLDGDNSDKLQYLIDGDKIVYRSDLDDHIKVAIALKNLRIMGQILRNFPGVLKGGPKRELAEESYLLGLRTLKWFLSSAKDNLPHIRALFVEIIRERRAIEDEAKLSEAADQALVWITRAVSFGIIKKVSTSIGLEELELTFREVRDRHADNNMTVRLIDVAIKLDHFKECPDPDLEELNQKLPVDSFAYTILRDFVADYLYLFVSDSRKLQKYGAMFDIETGAPKFHLNKKIKALVN